MSSKIAKTTNVSKDTNDFPTIQITYLERVSDAVVVNSYGNHCNPPLGTVGLQICTNGDEASKFFIPLSASSRPKGLKEGEFVTGNFKVGSIIKFDEQGNVDITCKKDLTANVEGNLNTVVNGAMTANITGNSDITCPQTTINGNVIINGNLTVSGTTLLTILSFLAGGSGTIPAGVTIDNQGTISGTGNIESNGIDLETHLTSGVTAGGDTSGQPV